MSGTFPASPAPNSLQIRSVTSTLVSHAQSMARQARSRGAQRWAFRLGYAPMTRAQWAPLFAFLVKQRGQYETFQFVLPVPLKTPLGAATGTPVVNNQSGSPEELQTGSRNVATSGWTAGITGIVKAADFLLFAGHSKVYMATADANSDGSGLATIAIEPALLAGPAHGAAITISSPAFTVALTQESLDTALQLGPHHRLELDLVEVYP